MKSSIEQFEDWFNGTMKPAMEKHIASFNDINVSYVASWHAWQASREAIEIELPKYHELTTQDTISARAEKSTYNFGIYDSADAIRAAGLTVKGDA